MSDRAFRLSGTSPDLTIELTPQAEKDLKEVGRLTRSLLLRGLKDRLLAHSPDLVTEVQREEGTTWYQLPVGNFRVLFRPVDIEDGMAGPARLIARIAHKDDLATALKELPGDEAAARQARPSTSGEGGAGAVPASG